MISEMWLDSILTNASKVMWEILGPKGIDVRMVGA